jgi:hypothetical protein
MQSFGNGEGIGWEGVYPRKKHQKFGDVGFILFPKVHTGPKEHIQYNTARVGTFAVRHWFWEERTGGKESFT